MKANQIFLGEFEYFLLDATGPAIEGADCLHDGREPVEGVNRLTVKADLISEDDYSSIAKTKAYLKVTRDNNVIYYNEISHFFTDKVLAVANEKFNFELGFFLEKDDIVDWEIEAYNVTGYGNSVIGQKIVLALVANQIYLGRFDYILRDISEPIIEGAYCLGLENKEPKIGMNRLYIGSSLIKESGGGLLNKRVAYLRIVRDGVEILNESDVDYFPEATSQVINDRAVFDGFILEGEDVIEWRYEVYNVSGFKAVKRGTKIAQDILANQVYVADFEYSLVDNKPPLILGISLLNGNGLPLREGDTRVKIFAESIYDEIGKLKRVTWQLGIGSENYIYSHTAEDPPPDGYFNGEGYHVFEVSPLVGGQTIYGKIIAEDVTNLINVVITGKVVIGVPANQIYCGDFSYELIADEESPVITDVVVSDEAGNDLEVGDTLVRLRAKVVDNHRLDIVGMKICVDDGNWQTWTDYSGVQGEISHIFSVDALVGGSLVYYQVYAKDVSGNETVTDLTYYHVTSGLDENPPDILDLVLADSHGRRISSDDKRLVAEANTYDMENGVGKLVWKIRIGSADWVEKIDISATGELDGKRQKDFDVRLSTFEEIMLSLTASDVVGNARTIRKWFLLEEFDYRKEIDVKPIKEVDVRMAEIRIKDLIIKDVAMPEGVDINTRWIKVSGDFISDGDRLKIKADNTIARLNHPNIKATSEVSYDGNVDVEVYDGYLLVKGNNDSWIDNLVVSSVL